MIRLLRTYLRPYARQLAAVMVLLLIQAIANLYLPDLNADIINNGIVKGDNDFIIRTGAFMLLVTLLLGLASILSVYLGSKAAMGFGRDVRGAIFKKVEGFSQVEVNHFGPASLITRNTNDVQQVQMVVFMSLTVLISAPILAVGGVIMAIRQDVPLSGLLIVILPIMGLVIGLVMVRAIPLFRAMQVKLDRINQVTRETLAGVRVIRAFVRTGHEEERFETANRDLFNTSIGVNRLFALTIPVMTGILNLSLVAVMWFGASRVESGGMPIGNLTAFLQYLMQILFAVLMAVIMFVFVPRAAVSAGRIQEVLEMEPSVRDPEQPIPLPRDERRGTVEFKGVEFGYPGAQEPVLHDISFLARPGQTTAIVGSTGSGKSTLVNLIPRFYDVTGGTVLVDGVDVRAVDRQDLWGTLGVIPRRRSCSAARSPATCATATRPRPTRSSGRRSRSPRAATSSRRWPAASRPRSPRAARTCPAASASGWRSPGRWSRRPTSTSSTTASRRSTSRPTPDSAPRSRRSSGRPP